MLWVALLALETQVVALLFAHTGGDLLKPESAKTGAALQLTGFFFLKA